MKTKYVNGNSQNFKDDPCESLKTALLITAGFKNSSLTPASKEKLALFKALVQSKLRNSKCGKKKAPPNPNNKGPEKTEVVNPLFKEPPLQFSSGNFKNKVKELESKIENLQSRPNNSKLLESVQQRARNLYDEVRRLRNTTVPKNVANAAEANLRKQLVKLSQETPKRRAIALRKRVKLVLNRKKKLQKQSLNQPNNKKVKQEFQNAQRQLEELRLQMEEQEKMFTEEIQKYEQIAGKADSNKEAKEEALRQLRNLTKQKAEVNAELQSSKNELTEFKKTVNQKARGIEGLLVKLGNKNEKRKQELELRLANIRALETRVEELSKKGSTNQATLNALRLELDHFKNMSTFYMGKAQESENIRTKYKELEKNFEELFAKHGELEGKLKNKNVTAAQRNEMARQIEQYALEKKELTTQMSNLRTKYESREKEVEKQISTLTEALSNSHKNASNKNGARKEAQEALRRLTLEHKELEGDRNAVKRTLQELEKLSRTNKLVVGIQKFRARVAARRLEALQANYEKRLANLTRQRGSNANARLQALEAKHAQNLANLQDKTRLEVEEVRRSTNTNKQQKLAELQQELQAIREARNSSQGKIAKLEGNLAALQNQVKNHAYTKEEKKKANSLLAEQKAQMNALQEKLESSTTSNAEARRKLQELGNRQKIELAALTAEMERHKSKLGNIAIRNLGSVNQQNKNASVKKLKLFLRRHGHERFGTEISAYVKSLLANITKNTNLLNPTKAEYLLELLKNDYLSKNVANHVAGIRSLNASARTVPGLDAAKTKQRSIFLNRLTGVRSRLSENATRGKAIEELIKIIKEIKNTKPARAVRVPVPPTPRDPWQQPVVTGLQLNRPVTPKPGGPRPSTFLRPKGPNVTGKVGEPVVPPSTQNRPLIAPPSGNGGASLRVGRVPPKMKSQLNKVAFNKWINTLGLENGIKVKAKKFVPTQVIFTNAQRELSYYIQKLKDEAERCLKASAEGEPCEVDENIQVKVKKRGPPGR